MSTQSIDSKGIAESQQWMKEKLSASRSSRLIYAETDPDTYWVSGSQSRSDAMQKILPHPAIEQRFLWHSSRSLATTLIVLFWFLFDNSFDRIRINAACTSQDKAYFFKHGITLQYTHAYISLNGVYFFPNDGQRSTSTSVADKILPMWYTQTLATRFFFYGAAAQRGSLRFHSWGF